MKTNIVGTPKGVGTDALNDVSKRTFKCLSCIHYSITVTNGNGGTSKTCNSNKKDPRTIVDLDAPNCVDYFYGW